MLRLKIQHHRIYAVIGIVLFISAGIFLLSSSRAASPFLSSEAESGTVTSPATVVSDSLASGTKAVKFAGAAAPPTTPVKLMPLGDSITDGHTVPGGYRILLWQELVQNDHDNIDFVGSLSSGPATLGDKDNEGHSGFCITGTCYGDSTQTLMPYIDGWLATYKPDIILLHIGTNDIGTGTTAATLTSELDTFIGKIFTDLPNVNLVLAKIIPMNDPSQDAVREAYNSSMNGIATKYLGEGRKIQIVDMSSLLTYPTDYSDTWHPNIQGYNMMANVWYPVVTALYKTY